MQNESHMVLFFKVKEGSSRDAEYPGSEGWVLRRQRLSPRGVVAESSEGKGWILQR